MEEVIGGRKARCRARFSPERGCILDAKPGVPGMERSKPVFVFAR
jgi:hypothetical protein